MNKVEKKRVKEQETIEKMIHIYCKKNHHTKELCSECKELVNYEMSFYGRKDILCTLQGALL